MTQPFLPRAVKLRHQAGDRAFVIEGAAAVVDPSPEADADLGILVWNMTLLYLPEGWRMHTVPEGAVRYAVPEGEGPLVRGQRSGGEKTVLVLIPATPDGQEAIARGTTYLYMRDLFLIVDDDARVEVRRTGEGAGVVAVETSNGLEIGARFDVLAGGREVELRCADLSATRRVPLEDASDAAIATAFASWVRAAGE